MFWVKTLRQTESIGGRESWKWVTILQAEFYLCHNLMYNCAHNFLIPKNSQANPQDINSSQHLCLNSCFLIFTDNCYLLQSLLPLASKRLYAMQLLIVSVCNSSGCSFPKESNDRTSVVVFCYSWHCLPVVKHTSSSSVHMIRILNSSKHLSMFFQTADDVRMFFLLSG